MSVAQCEWGGERTAGGKAVYRYSWTCHDVRRVHGVKGYHDLAGSVTFVMLNPSTADETGPDPTIRRCCKFAAEWGIKRVVVANLFAMRATNPAMLAKARQAGLDPVGPLNDASILEASGQSPWVICAWGTHGRLWERDKEVISILRKSGVNPMALRINPTSRTPGHPLYLPGAARPFYLE